MSIKSEEIKNFVMQGGRMSGKTFFGECLMELYKTKKIEEQIGFSLDITFRALKEGIWVEEYNSFK